MLPILYLRGLSIGGFASALTEVLGSDAGLSATSITRLVETYEAETRSDAHEVAEEQPVRQFGGNYPKAVAKLDKPVAQLDLATSSLPNPKGWEVEILDQTANG